jgi:hypothetical protein
MAEASDVKTMKLRYVGACVGCERVLPAGERAHYLRATKSVRCLECGTGSGQPAGQAVGVVPELVVIAPQAVPAEPARDRAGSGELELVQGPVPKTGTCGDCGRQVRRGTEALHGTGGRTLLCLECVAVDTAHSLGTPGAGARIEHAKRLERHQSKVRTRHPRLGGVILALSDEPQHVTAWRTGAVGEEEFGRKLSQAASPKLIVLHDRKLPGSRANIDHVAVTPGCVWILDAKRYKGKVETRGHGPFSRRPPDLFVGGRNQTKLVEGVKKQVEAVRSILAPLAGEHGSDEFQVRGGLVFIGADFGLFASPFAVDGVWVGWGKAIRKRLSYEGEGPLAASEVAKRLAREVRA